MATTTLCRYCARDLTPSEQVLKMRYCQADLEKHFRLVRNAEDWKAPIDTYIHLDRRDVSVVKAAIAHFTGTRATVTLLEKGMGGNEYKVTAKGYRFGPAGDR